MHWPRDAYATHVPHERALAVRMALLQVLLREQFQLVIFDANLHGMPVYVG